jgi:hypothetical protein
MAAASTNGSNAGKFRRRSVNLDRRWSGLPAELKGPGDYDKREAQIILKTDERSSGVELGPKVRRKLHELGDLANARSVYLPLPKTWRMAY